MNLYIILEKCVQFLTFKLIKFIWWEHFIYFYRIQNVLITQAFSGKWRQKEALGMVQMWYTKLIHSILSVHSIWHPHRLLNKQPIDLYTVECSIEYSFGHSKNECTVHEDCATIQIHVKWQVSNTFTHSNNVSLTFYRWARIWPSHFRGISNLFIYRSFHG